MTNHAFRLLLVLSLPLTLSAATFDVKSFGASGDGKTLDTAAINKAIDAAAAAGGGTVQFGAGTFVAGSIHLKSHITLYLDSGSTIEASTDPTAYDPPEPNDAWEKYQDYGHNHFHNSLIWGENLTDIAILGPGRIFGKGLLRNAGPRTAPMFANKAISLKMCRNVIIRDVSILMGGHFAILATGVDNMTIDNLKIDTNRDGIDVVSSKNVRISNCTVNSPADDGIVIKADYALGAFRDVENLTIVNCQVSGFVAGTLLDGTYKKADAAPDREGATGRIKFGTESSGGFKNVTIANCVFVHSRGLALETVDGGVMEDIAITNITMRDITNAPIFLRLGSRMRSPEGTPVGAMRRVTISHVVVYDADPRQASIISGIPGHNIEDVKLNDIRIYYRGGGTKEDAALVPPENETTYPEPRMFGVIPAYGFLIRHVAGIELRDVEVSYAKEDLRPAFLLMEVKDAEFNHVRAQHATGVPTFVMKDVEDVTVHGVRGVADTHVDKAKDKVM